MITDLAEYVFEDRELTLKSAHTGIGVTLEKVKAEVGWDIKTAKDLSESQPPTEEELSTLRRYVQHQLSPAE